MVHVVMLLALAGLLAPAPAADAASPMQPGLWEITMRMEMPGMAMPPQTVTQCIQNTESPEAIVPAQENCTIQSRSMVGNRMTWAMRCQHGTTVMDGTGEMTMSATSYEGVTRMTVTEGGQATRMTSHYTGRRVGNC